jgi:hypothetical protein
MDDLFAQVIPMALAAAISPVIFLLQLDTLTGARPIARGAAVTAGAAGVLILVSSAGVLLGGSGPSAEDWLQALIKVGFGALLIAIGIRALVRPPTPKTSSRSTPRGVGRSFVAGAAAMASNLTTFALYIPALALVVGSGLPRGQQGVVALIMLLLTLMVAWVPLVSAAVIPGATERWLPAVGRWMTANDRWIRVVLGFGFGLWLLLAGVRAL